ncbi:hypothetical protein EDWATA_02068, partial [Edwardsiella tarda ATCC 23685]
MAFNFQDLYGNGVQIPLPVGGRVTHGDQLDALRRAGRQAQAATGALCADNGMHRAR